MKQFIVLTVVMIVPVLAFAQGSGGRQESSSPPAAGSNGSPIQAFETTKSIKLRLVAVRNDGTLAVTDEKGAPLTAKVDKKVAIRADKGTELSGQKHIQLSSLEPGMLLKVTYRTSDQVVVELRILKEPKKEG